MPNNEKVTKQFGDRTFELTPLFGTDLTKALHRVIAFLGPGIGPLIQHFSGKATKQDFAAMLLVALPEVFMRNDDEKTVAFVKLLLKECSMRNADGKTARVNDVFDVLFQGDLFTQMELAAWSMEVNFAPFLSKLGGLIGAKRIVGAAEQSSSSPQS